MPLKGHFMSSESQKDSSSSWPWLFLATWPQASFSKPQFLYLPQGNNRPCALTTLVCSNTCVSSTGDVLWLLTPILSTLAGARSAQELFPLPHTCSSQSAFAGSCWIRNPILSHLGTMTLRSSWLYAISQNFPSRIKLWFPTGWLAQHHVFYGSPPLTTLFIRLSIPE